MRPTQSSWTDFSTIAQLILERRKQEEVRRVIEWCNAVELPIALEQLGGADLLGKRYLKGKL